MLVIVMWFGDVYMFKQSFQYALFIKSEIL